MAQQISTNTFGVAKWVVSPDATQGTHTTIQAAINSASSGDNIFIRAGTYTENLTLKAGVNISGLIGDANVPTATVVGNCTFTGAGTVTIAGIRLQTNANFAITVSGSSASILKIRDCFLNFTNNTGISYTSTNAASALSVIRCTIDLGTTGIALYSMTSTGTLTLSYTNTTNTGGSSTASTSSAGIVNCLYTNLLSPVSTSGTAVFNNTYSSIDTSAQNVTCQTSTGNGTHVANYSSYSSGTASALNIGGTSTQTLSNATVTSSNVNAITGGGSGILRYSLLRFSGSSAGINVPTISPFVASDFIGTTLSLANDANASTLNLGTGAAVKAVTLGSTTASSTTTIQAPSAGVKLLGVQGVAVANKNYVTINTATGAIGSDAGPSVGITWTVISANQTAAVNNGYFCNKAGTLALALPASSAVGDVIEVANINTATGTQFTQAAGQQIFIGNTSTTLGATGTLTSSALGDTLKIVCRTANTTWQATSIIGNWSVV